MKIRSTRFVRLCETHKEKVIQMKKYAADWVRTFQQDNKAGGGLQTARVAVIVGFLSVYNTNISTQEFNQAAYKVVHLDDAVCQDDKSCVKNYIEKIETVS